MINCDLKKNWNRKVCKKSVGEAHFTLIYPKADNSNNKINQTEFNKYVNKINSRFGGSTTKPITLGCWIDEKRNKLNCESGFAVETFRDFDSGMKKLNVIERKKQLEKDYKFLRKIAKDSAIDFGQESILVQFDNIRDVTFIPGKRIDRLNIKKLRKEDLFSDSI